MTVTLPWDEEIVVRIQARGLEWCVVREGMCLSGALSDGSSVMSRG